MLTKGPGRNLNGKKPRDRSKQYELNRIKENLIRCN